MRLAFACSEPQPGVHVKNVGPNAFSLVATLFWWHGLQPGRNMLVSGARRFMSLRGSTSGRTVPTRQASSEPPRRKDDLGNLQI